MAIQTKEKTIDNRQIMVTQYPGTTALFNKMKILRLLGPGISAAFEKVNPESIDPNESGGKLEILIQAIGYVCSTIDPKQFTDFVIELLKSTRLKCGSDFMEITPEVFDLEFAGELNLMYKILWFVLEVNYGNFFGKGGLGEMLKRKQPNPPASKK